MKTTLALLPFIGIGVFLYDMQKNPVRDFFVFVGTCGFYALPFVIALEIFGVLP